MNAVVEPVESVNEFHQVLTFTLAGESMGVAIQRVQEIRGWTAATPVPGAPPYVLGVLNLRGSVVPVVDLRARLNLERVEYTQLTVIVVLSVETSGKRSDFGIVVDAVSDVADVRPEDLRPPPELGADASSGFIRALAMLSERVVMLLDVDRLLGHQG